MQIILNGKPKDIEETITIGELLTQLGINADEVAVEHNLQAVVRSSFGAIHVTAGDHVEVVRFVGGG